MHALTYPAVVSNEFTTWATVTPTKPVQGYLHIFSSVSQSEYLSLPLDLQRAESYQSASASSCKPVGSQMKNA